MVWRKGRKVALASSEELTVALDRFERDALADPDRPLLAEVTDLDGNCLIVGIAAQGAYFEFVSKEINQNQPYTDLVCVGDDEAEETVDFFCCGHHTQLKCRNLIPVRVMRDTLRHYLETGELSERVRWQCV
jgi:hypothetical protein